MQLLRYQLLEPALSETVNVIQHNVHQTVDDFEYFQATSEVAPRKKTCAVQGTALVDSWHSGTSGGL